MKLYFFNILILLMVNLGLPLATYAQLIPQTETDFTNPSNFPTVPGDAMTLGLTQEHFINITTTRPVIKFDNTVASPTSAYLGTAIEMKQGENFLTPIALIIEEQVGALLPFQEIEATQLAPTIDPARIRVSLVKKSDYDAAVISSVSLNGFDALNNPMPNNDLPTLTNFSYLSQENFINNQNDIPTGEYYIKYDYSSPDSNVIIKNEGDKLGNVFAKSIYRSLVVLPNSISRVNPNLRIRVSN